MKLNKLILSFYIGVISLGVSTLGMSIAWYSSSDFVQIVGIEMVVDSDRDLVISTTKDGEYKDSLDESNLMEVHGFAPRTSAHAGDWMSSKSKTPMFYDEAVYSSTEFGLVKKVADDGYFSQRLYLKADDDLYISVSADKTYIKPNEAYNENYAHTLFREYQEGDNEALKSLTVEEIKARLNGLVNAMRFSLLICDDEDYQYVIIDPHKDGVTYMGGLLDNDVDRYYDSYVSESDDLSYERVYGEIIGDASNIVYDDPLEVDSGFKNEDEDPSAFNAKHKKGVRRFNLEQSKLNGVEIKEEPSMALSEFDTYVKPFHFPVYRNKPKEVVLSLYIEGWDLDSINYTMGATFLSNFTFMIEREM